MQLTRKTYTLPTADGDQTLKWGTWAMRLFCQKQGISIDEFFTLITDLSEGGATADKMLSVICSMISAGYEAANGKTVSDATVYDWIDDNGGIISINKGGLSGYVSYIVSQTINDSTPLNSVEDEEKQSESQAPGMTS